MMTRAKNLGELEQQAYRSRWADGLVDLLAGVGVLFVGVSWAFELVWAAALIVPVLLIAWIGVRQRVVEPRIGRVRFSRDRREREAAGTRYAAWVGVGVLAFVLASSFYFPRASGGVGARLDEWIAALPAGLLALMALMAAAMTGITRFIGYAVLLLAVGSIGTLGGLEPDAQILVAGGAITVIGAILFTRFLAGHPRPAELGEEA